MEAYKKFQVLNGGHLKWIALITMTIDHIGAGFFPHLLFLRMIGRIAFPLFCLELAEGAYHTQNKIKYGIRLALLGIISEPIFDRMGSGTFYDPNRQSVMITLFIGFLILCFWQWDWKVKTKGFVLIKELCNFAVFALGAYLALLLKSDYKHFGVLLICLFYSFRRSRLGQGMGNVAVNSLLYGGIQSYASVASIPICLYNGKPGKRYQYLFYIYYPLHLFIIITIKKFFF